MIYALGEVSGAHLNPAVTIGFFAAQRFPDALSARIHLSQLLGAILASTALRLLFPQDSALGGTHPHGSILQSFVLEVILTAILMFRNSQCFAPAPKRKASPPASSRFGNRARGIVRRAYLRRVNEPRAVARAGLWCRCGSMGFGFTDGAGPGALLGVLFACRLVHEKGCCGVVNEGKCA